MKNFVKITALLLMCLCVASCGDMSDKENENSSDVDSIQSTQQENTENTTVGLNPEEMTTKDTVSDSPTVNPSNTDRCIYGENTGTSKTVTGLEPLPTVDYKLKDYSNTAGYSTEMISHSYGVAQNETAHTISVTNQKLFDEKGYDALCLDTKSDEKVLYLTFDCGYENGYTAKILDVLKDKQVPAAFFCTLPQMKDNHDIIARMITEGHIVGNHSVTHPDFSTLSNDEIVEEIKGFDDYIRENFGYSALYFRYPQGKYSEKSMRAVNELGFKCVFWSLAYADWDLENQKGASYALDTVMSRIHPGAVILLHAVSPDNANALADIIDTARAKGYEFKSLDNVK